MSSSKLSTSWAGRLPREMGNGVQFPLPSDGGAREGLKKSMALPFRPVGARWPGGKGYGTPEGAPRVHLRGPWGCGWEGGLPAQGKERWLGNRQSWVRLFAPTSGESFGQYIYIYTQNKTRGCF